MTDASGNWIDDELASGHLVDRRLDRRLHRVLEQLVNALGESLPLACQDWANTKAAYRFFANDRVGEGDILAGHFEATRRRVAAALGVILVVQDTTEFSFERERPDQVGWTYKGNGNNHRQGGVRPYTACGLLMHSSLAITTDGLPLGLGAVKFWTRKTFKGTGALKRHINPTRVPIDGKESIRWLDNMRRTAELFGDPGRCVHVGDRENDIYEFFCLARDLGTHFLVRTCVDRLAGDGTTTVARLMGEVAVGGRHRIAVRGAAGRTETAEVELTYATLHVRPPIGKEKRYPALDLTILHARELEQPENRPRIDWKLATDLPVADTAAAVEKLRWYALRWRVEEFHKILKSGCKVEAARLRTAERLVKLIAVLCIVGWRVFWLRMMNRVVPDVEPGIALTGIETAVLDRVVPDTSPNPSGIRDLASYVRKIARLGGWLARAGDSPPGDQVLWRGMARLADIVLGATLALDDVGN
ncbi:IS4 family transposase [Azospirillum brasilense]|nr:IS4 family transposase [Azospirillum argentinense]MBK3804435.1 IS4 family transposase [Azospirillum argentinense]